MSATSSRTVTIRTSQGLHARPALALVRLVKSSGSVVTITGANAVPVDASSLLSLMAGGFAEGSDVVLRVDGADGDVLLDQAEAILTAE